MDQPVSMAFPWYRPEEWSRLATVADDHDAMEPSYRDWLTAAEKQILQMALVGIRVERVEVDVTELVAWCAARNFPNISATRSQYASELMQRGASRSSGMT
jgi:hypothetical protein